jgi:hypothetical protein
MAGSETVEGSSRGLFERFSVDNANRNAISRVGLVDENGIPRDRFAFLVANVGNRETPGRGGQPVDVSVALFDGSEKVSPTPQLSLPYRVVSPDGDVVGQGSDLAEETIQLPTGNIVEVAIEVDSRSGTDDIERIETMQFVAQPPGGP